MSSSNNPSRSYPLILARSTAGVPWTPSKPAIQLFGHLLKIKGLIDQISFWANYDFPTINIPPIYWIECKATLAQLHEAFLFSNYLMTKIAFSILHSGHSYRHYQADLELFWEVSNEQYKELTRLIKKSEEDTFKALQLQQPNVRNKPIPFHQSGIAGFELMPTFLQILTRNNLFTGLAARVKELTYNVQRVLQDAGDYNMPPEMNDAEFHEVLTQIANSSSAARRSRHARREALSIPFLGNDSRQSIDPVAGMSAMRLGGVTAGPTEGEMRTMPNYAEDSNSEPGSDVWDRTLDKPAPRIQIVKEYQPVVVTPSQRRLRRMRSHRGVIVVEKESIGEDSEDRTEEY